MNLDLLIEKIILENTNLDTTERAIDAVKTKTANCKMNPCYKNFGSNEELITSKLREAFDIYFDKFKSLKVPEKQKTWGIQFLLGHTNYSNIKDAANNDALYQYLMIKETNWAKQMPVYQKFETTDYDKDFWTEFEVRTQEEQQKHGNKVKGSGSIKDVSVAYKKDSNGWELLIPNSFEGEKAAAFYGKEGEEQKPTHWCTRANLGYYNHYTDKNTHPLYIIRNYITGRSYQIGFTKDYDNNTTVHFLDDQDVKGDEITNGDLSNVPNELLKFIVNPFDKNKWRSLNDYKKAKSIDPNEGKENYRDYRKTTFGKPVKVDTKYLPQIVKQMYGKDAEGYDKILINQNGPIMKVVSKGGTAKAYQGEIGDAYTDFYKTNKKIVKNFFESAGQIRYYFEKLPNEYVEFTLYKGNVITRRKNEKGTSYMLQYVGRIDLGIDISAKELDTAGKEIEGTEMIQNKKLAINSRRQAEFNSKLKKVHKIVLEKCKNELDKLYADDFITNKESESVKLPKENSFRKNMYDITYTSTPGSGVAITKAGENIYYCLADKLKKDNLKVTDEDDVEIKNNRIREAAWKIMTTYHREYVKEFENIIINNRAEGNYERNMYEEIQNYFNY